MAEMKFCSICDNMLYIDVRDNGRMVWNCLHCSMPDEIANKDMKDDASVMVSHTEFKNESAKYQHLMTPYVHIDPTIPRTTTIVCTNSECSKKASDPNNVLYMKYDHHNMNFLYSCAYCKHFWVTASRS